MFWRLFTLTPNKKHTLLTEMCYRRKRFSMHKLVIFLTADFVFNKINWFLAKLIKIWSSVNTKMDHAWIFSILVLNGTQRRHEGTLIQLAFISVPPLLSIIIIIFSKKHTPKISKCLNPLLSIQLLYSLLISCLKLPILLSCLCTYVPGTRNQDQRLHFYALSGSG